MKVYVFWNMNLIVSCEELYPCYYQLLWLLILCMFDKIMYYECLHHDVFSLSLLYVPVCIYPYDCPTALSKLKPLFLYWSLELLFFELLIKMNRKECIERNVVYKQNVRHFLYLRNRHNCHLEIITFIYINILD